MSIGKKLKQFRLGLELSQKEMSEKLGVSQPYYSSVEGDKKPLTTKMLANIKIKYKVDLYYFTDSQSLANSNNLLPIGDSITEIITNQYYNRKIEIIKDSGWYKLNDEVRQKVEKVNFLYQRIVDVKVLLHKKLKVKIKSFDSTFSFTIFEYGMINAVCGGTGIDGYMKADNSTFEELTAYTKELFNLTTLLELRFFELFKILFTGLEESKKHRDIPSEID